MHYIEFAIVDVDGLVDTTNWLFGRFKVNFKVIVTVTFKTSYGTHKT